MVMRRFSIAIEELERYVSIDHQGDNGSAAATPFEKMALDWPLELCRQKVEIIDSPGLNDPDSHDTITLEYLPNADAVLYCMSCEHVCTKVDLETIQMLRDRGYTSILFVLTKFDRVRESAEQNQTDEEREFVHVSTEKLKGLTELGKKGIFFVDSKHGVTAKENRNLSMLATTGIPEFEEYLESYLVQNRFRSKLTKAIVTLRSANAETRGVIEHRGVMALTSLEQLEEGLRKAPNR